MNQIEYTAEIVIHIHLCIPYLWSMDDRIVLVLDYIEDNLSTVLTLEVLAGVACLSPSRFHRLFKKDTGKTPFKFIEEIRVTRAYDMIVRERSKVHEIASQLGYKDYETFSRVFKKHFQLAPDDLKAIYVTLKDSLIEQDGKVIITTVTSERNLNEELIKQVLESKNITLREAEDVQVFKILRVEDETEHSDRVIKNKFYLTADKKIGSKYSNVKKNDANTSF